MIKSLADVRALLQRHYVEAHDGLVNKAPSQLLRGEGTEKNYYIMKIDLVGSTGLLMGRQKSTYLKLAHTYLSTIDKITQDFGADPEQVEYAGDSVLAYFGEKAASAEDVITAACYSRAAVQQIPSLDSTLNSIPLKCKIVVHFASLIVSRIGPRANSILTAIGHPIHQVAKIEKDIAADSGRATKEFYQKIKADNRKFLIPVDGEVKIPVQLPPSMPLNSLGDFHSGPGMRSIAEMLYPPSLPPPPAQKFKIEKNVIGYDLRWPMLFEALHI